MKTVTSKEELIAKSLIPKPEKEYVVVKHNYHRYSKSVKEAISRLKEDLNANKEEKLLANPYFKVYEVTNVGQKQEIWFFDEAISYEEGDEIVYIKPIYMTHLESYYFDLNGGKLD